MPEREATHHPALAIPELVTQIFKELVASYDDRSLVMTDLLSCSLVCKHWNQLAVPFLYAECDIEFIHSLGRLQTTLTRHPHKAACVRQVRISRRCSKVCEMEPVTLKLGKLLRDTRSGLQRLYIILGTTAPLLPCLSLPSAIFGCKNLQRLHISGDSSLTEPAGKQLKITFTFLERLVLRHVALSPRVIKGLFSSPALRFLELRETSLLDPAATVHPTSPTVTASYAPLISAYSAFIRHLPSTLARLELRLRNVPHLLAWVQALPSLQGVTRLDLFIHGTLQDVTLSALWHLPPNLTNLVLTFECGYPEGADRLDNVMQLACTDEELPVSLCDVDVDLDDEYASHDLDSRDERIDYAATVYGLEELLTPRGIRIWAIFDQDFSDLEDDGEGDGARDDSYLSEAGSDEDD